MVDILNQHLFMVDWFVRLADHFGQDAIAEDLKSIVNDPSITAWIAVNDATAVAALKVLRRHRIAVPGRISLASFDDSSAALHQGITSCNFNVEGLVEGILNFILQPAQHAEQPSRIEVPAVLIHRHTTGPARAR